MENSHIIDLKENSWLPAKLVDFKEIMDLDQKSLIIKFDSDKRYPSQFFVLDYLLRMCIVKDIRYLTLENIEFYNNPSDMKFITYDWNTKIYLVKLTMINCNSYGISEFLSQYKNLNIRHMEIHNEFFLKNTIKLNFKNYYILSLKEIANDGTGAGLIPISEAKLPLKGSNKIKDREVILKVTKELRNSNIYNTSLFLKNIDVFSEYTEKLNSLENGPSILINTVLARNNIIYGNCQKLCITFLALWKRRNNKLQVFPRDLIRILTEIIWETRFNPLFWNTSLVP